MYSCYQYTNISCYPGKFEVSESSDGIVTIQYASGVCQTAHPGISGVVRLKREGNQLLGIAGNVVGTFDPLSFSVSELSQGGRNVSLSTGPYNNFSVQFNQGNTNNGSVGNCVIYGSVRY